MIQNPPRPGAFLYAFIAEEGTRRGTLTVLVEPFAKPAVPTAIGQFGPNGTYGMQSMKNFLEKPVADGMRILSRFSSDKPEEQIEAEYVALSKGAPAADGKEWVALCFSSAYVDTPAGDHQACTKFRLLP